jgi:hypothetical protein
MTRLFTVNFIICARRVRTLALAFGDKAATYLVLVHDPVPCSEGFLSPGTLLTCKPAQVKLLLFSLFLLSSNATIFFHIVKNDGSGSGDRLAMQKRPKDQ